MNKRKNGLFILDSFKKINHSIGNENQTNEFKSDELNQRINSILILSFWMKILNVVSENDILNL